MSAIATVYVADQALDVVETTRRLIYIFNQELDNAEAGVIDVQRGAVDLKLRQVEAARRVIADVEVRHAEIPEYKTALIAGQLERVAARLEHLGERL